MNANEIIFLSRRVLGVYKFCALMLLVSLVGCGKEQASLYEHDHFVPPHWPKNLQHASELIASRAQVAEQDATARKELDEILSWLPEIAADTDLSEEDWLLLLPRCESLRRSLQGTYSDGLRAELQQMAATLEATHQTILSLRPPGWSSPGDDDPDTSDNDDALESVEKDGSQADEQVSSDADDAP